MSIRESQFNSRITTITRTRCRDAQAGMTKMPHAYRAVEIAACLRRIGVRDWTVEINTNIKTPGQAIREDIWLYDASGQAQCRFWQDVDTSHWYWVNQKGTGKTENPNMAHALGKAVIPT